MDKEMKCLVNRVKSLQKQVPGMDNCEVINGYVHEAENGYYRDSDDMKDMLVSFISGMSDVLKTKKVSQYLITVEEYEIPDMDGYDVKNEINHLSGVGYRVSKVQEVNEC